MRPPQHEAKAEAEARYYGAVAKAEYFGLEVTQALRP